MKEQSVISKLESGNKRFQNRYGSLLRNHVEGQSPHCAILTCADSRVIPEYIFDAGIGELFVVRVAGNIAIDPTVIASLEYAVDHLQVPMLLILGHTNCGAVHAAEQDPNPQTMLLREIQKGFEKDPSDHIRGNLLHQLEEIPRRSTSIKNALDEHRLILKGALYHLEDGTVEFLQLPLKMNKGILL